MADTLGWRMKFAVLTPLPNTVVQPEYEAMRPVGVTNHVYRLQVQNVRWGQGADFEEIQRQLDAGLEPAIDQAMNCNPGHLILAAASESVWGGGVAAGNRVAERVEQRTGGRVKLTQAAHAVPAALAAYGGGKRLALLTPYHAIAEKHLRDFMDQIGYQVIRVRNLTSDSPNAIGEMTERQLRAELRALDGEDIDAIFQFGSGIPMMRLAAEAERWLEKPVIAINTATYWHALRQNGIDDKVQGCGRLLSEF